MNLLKEGKTNWKYILIVVILVVIVGGGILGFCWWATKEAKIPEVKVFEGIIVDEQKLAEDTVNEYVKALISRGRDTVLPYLTGKAKEEVEKWPATFGTSNPRLGSFEIISSKKRNTTEFEFVVREYQEYTGEGIIGYNDETLIVIKVNNKYLISSIQRGEYTALEKEIREEARITVSIPVEGETWIKGRTHFIQWGPLLTREAREELDMILNDVRTGISTIIEENILSNAYSFTVPEGLTSGNKYQICIIGEKSKGCSSLFSIISEEEAESFKWGTYQNRDYGFEVKYPLYCTVRESSSGISINNTCGFSVGIYNNPENLSLDEWLDRRREKSPTEVDLGYRIPISIDGVPGLKGLDGCCMVFIKAVVLLKEGKIYFISGNENIFDQKEEVKLWIEGEIEESDDIFNQTLSTFRFLE